MRRFRSDFAGYVDGCALAAILFVIVLSLIATTTDFATAAQDDKKDSANGLLTFSGQILVLLGALLGAGGGLRYFLEPILKRRHLRKVMATGLWLSCSELRRHLEAIKAVLENGGPKADEMRF